jgi:Cof subfamily protein (haloacid dehalogenase superfamily)
MKKKYIFMDLDGTIIDHGHNGVLPSTKYTINELQKNGHEVVIATGRPPALFFDIDKKLGISSYVAANGALAVFNNEIILSDTIDKKLIDKLIAFSIENKIDLGFESSTHFCLFSQNTDLPKKFCEVFHLPDPEVIPDHYKENDIYQMVLFYSGDDFKKFETQFPGLWFNYSNPHGLDVNLANGLKDAGLRAFHDILRVPIEDMIAIGDGFNDITMIEYAGIGIAMGNASEAVKKKADVIADRIENDGLYKVFLNLGLIEKADFN